ncbi:hypothetical protein OH76DRAFT_1481998 [Lentinus brumalis]|uniref:Uncharacterized protein n=1 Tax=Lentinus brumalis TaxID=2498619 RepID=A0A371DEG5_9APHY|nr:hypothetical protein OH76DRAFT_1481998 [Polyporus brumalis]
MAANSVELSTPHAAFAEGLTDSADNSDQWKHVSVTLAELSAATLTYAIVVCEALECDLIIYPPVPLVQLVLPLDRVAIESCSTDARVVGLRRRTGDRPVDFRLRFDHLNEFWDFLRIVSRVESEYQILRANYVAQMGQVVDSVPSHEPSPALRVLCSYEAHRPNDERNAD